MFGEATDLRVVVFSPSLSIRILRTSETSGSGVTLSLPSNSPYDLRRRLPLRSPSTPEFAIRALEPNSLKYWASRVTSSNIGRYEIYWFGDGHLFVWDRVPFV